MIAGKAVGIVLCGGGSRGLAHLGVLTALEDAGVPLDCVGGTSQGAFMAALYAQVGHGGGLGGGRGADSGTPIVAQTQDRGPRRRSSAHALRGPSEFQASL